MKEIELSQGQVALVDDEDYEWLNQWKWSASWSPDTNSYYAQRGAKKSESRTGHVYMHRAILGLISRRLHADHVNHDTLDNRRANLRAASCRQNHANARNQSKHGVGVAYRAGRKSRPFMAHINLNRRTVFLGYFATAEEAKAHRDKVIAELEEKSA